MLDYLDENQHVALMELLIYMAKVDGDFSDIEKEVIQQYGELLGVDVHAVSGNRVPEELVQQFQSPASRVAVLQELLRIAHLDGNFHRDEADTIDDIAEMMGLPPMYVKKVDDWVQWGLNWVWQGEDLLEEAEEML
mgnify:CR=1 FL=1